MTKKSILFVDDDEILAIIGKMILEKQGYKVSIFTYSVEALKIFCQTPYALFLKNARKIYVFSNQTLSANSCAMGLKGC